MIIGPTRPVYGSPSAFSPNPPSGPKGVKPASMKNAVISPQAMNAPMLGMIIPERNVPKRCTCARAAVDRPPAGAVVSEVVAVAMVLS